MNLSNYIKEYGNDILTWPDSAKDAAAVEWLGMMIEETPYFYETKFDEIQRILIGLASFMISNGSKDQIKNLKDDLYQAVEQDLITAIERSK